MRHKSTLFFLMYLVILLPFNLLFTPILNDSSHKRVPLQSLAPPNTEWGVYANWTETGDFLDWYIVDGSPAIFDDTGDHLWCRCDATDEANISRDLADTSCTYVQNYSLYYHIYSQYASPTYPQFFNMSFYYTDASHDVLKSIMITETPFEWTEWFNGIFNSNKIIDYIWISIEIGSSGYLSFYLYDELYEGHVPIISDITMAPLQPREHQSIFFGCNILNSAFLGSSDIVLNIIYLDTLNTHSLNMNKDWIDDYFYSVNLTLSRAGLYKFGISDYIYGWDAIINSIFYTFEVYPDGALLYPTDAKLTLWEPLGTAIPTNLKVFLGQSESYELYMPQINKVLNWNPYAANSTTRFIHYYEEDNKILFNCTKNGIKAIIPDLNGTYPDIEHYESFVFDIRMREFYSNDHSLLIGFNYFQADYALTISDNIIDEWVQYIIPIPLFNWHNYSSALAHLIFYGSFRAEIKNIFVADYRNITTLLDDASNTTTVYESINETYQSSLISIEANEKTPSVIWQNASFYCEETHFNVTGHVAENITIAGNETVKLNLTGNYIATHSFTNDEAGSFPDDWDCDGAVQVIPWKVGHNKVLELIGTDDSDVAINTFADRNDGTIELFIRVNDTQHATIFCIEDSVLSNSILFGIAYDYFMFISNTYPTGYFIQACSANTWYHLRFAFNITAGEWEVWINYVHRGMYDYYGTPIMMDRVCLMDFEASGEQQAAYIDAVDYSWSPGYFLNRNWANTYFNNGTYVSKSYDLGVADFYFYQNLNLSKSIDSNTALTVEYRYSLDNETWLDWSNAFTENTTINEYKNRYFQFRLNLSTWGNYIYTPQCYLINFSYTNANTTFFIEDILQPSFSPPPFLHNVTLKIQVDSIDNLINSSINLYNFTSSSYENISSIEQTCVYNVTSDYYNATNHVKLNITIFASENFTLSYDQAYLLIFGHKFNKTCEILKAFSLNNDFNYTVFYYIFNPPTDSIVDLYFYNGTHWNLHSTYENAANITTNSFYYFQTFSLSKLKFKFIYCDAYLNDLNVTANITRYFFIAEQSYRLISEQNRAATDFLIFDQATEWLCLTDYYGTIIYKQLHNRTAEGYFIDVMLNCFDVLFSNYVPDSIVTFQVKNRNLDINVTVPYGLTIPITLFTDDYVVVLWNDENKTVINTWDLTISRVKNRRFVYNVTIPLEEHEPSIWDQLAEYWYVFVILIAIFIIALIVRKYFNKLKNLLFPQRKSSKAEAEERSPRRINKKRKKEPNLYI